MLYIYASWGSLHTHARTHTCAQDRVQFVVDKGMLRQVWSKKPGRCTVHVEAKYHHFITELLATYASVEDCEEEDSEKKDGKEEAKYTLFSLSASDADCEEDHASVEAPVESEEDDASEEEDDGDKASLAPDCEIVLEDFQRQVFTVGPGNEIITYVRMFGRWVNVTANTSIDVKHRLPPRTGAKVQRHRDNDAGADQWQAWYPGAVPASRHCAGSNAREEVLKWCWERHVEYQQANYEVVE